jgi:hypothetical protein
MSTDTLAPVYIVKMLYIVKTRGLTTNQLVVTPWSAAAEGAALPPAALPHIDRETLNPCGRGGARGRVTLRERPGRHEPHLRLADEGGGGGAAGPQPPHRGDARALQSAHAAGHLGGREQVTTPAQHPARLGNASSACPPARPAASASGTWTPASSRIPSRPSTARTKSPRWRSTGDTRPVAPSGQYRTMLP